MAFKLLDRVRFAVGNTPGTGSITVGLATTGYQLPAGAGAANGDTFSYVAVDGAAWEYGVATYSSSGPSITRSVTQSSAGGTTALTLTGNAIVTATVRGEDVASSFAGLSDVDFTSLANGQVPKYNSTSGKWENADGGGGLSEGWEALTFTNTTTIFGTAGTYVSDQTFTLAADEVLEIEGFVYKSSSNNGLLGISEDGTNGYVIYNGTSGSTAINYYAGSSYNAMSSGSSQNWTGMHKIEISAAVMGSTENAVWGMVDGSPQTAVQNNSVNLVGTVTAYLVTNDITKCAFKARVVTPTVYS